jgi:hypothetical protein
MRRPSATGGFAALLACAAAFESWNHRTGAAPLVAGALLPELPLGRRALHQTGVPLALGLAGFRAPQGRRLQVAALAWAAHVYAHRALGYDARD